MSFSDEVHGEHCGQLHSVISDRYGNAEIVHVGPAPHRRMIFAEVCLYVRKVLTELGDPHLLPGHLEYDDDPGEVMELYRCARVWRETFTGRPPGPCPSLWDESREARVWRVFFEHYYGIRPREITLEDISRAWEGE